MKTDDFDWDTFKVFKVAAERGSLRNASAYLETSTATVTRAINKLEKQLGSELIKRDAKGIRLTEAGVIALRHAQIMSESLDAIIADASDEDSQIEGPVHLLTGDGLGPYWIAPRLAQFHQENPKIEVKLTISEGNPDIDSHDADIAIQFEEPRRTDLVSKRMGVLHYMLYASQDYLDLYGEPVSLFDFDRHRLLTHTSYVHQMTNWRPKTADLRRIIDISLLTNSAAALIKSCESGGGIALLPSYIQIPFPKLVPIQLPELAPIQFWITYSERVRRLARGRIVLEFLRTCFDTREIPWFRQDFVHPRPPENGAIALTRELQERVFDE